MTAVRRWGTGGMPESTPTEPVPKWIVTVWKCIKWVATGVIGCAAVAILCAVLYVALYFLGADLGLWDIMGSD